MSEEKEAKPNTISRRQFLRDAGLVVGGTAVGSAFLLTACGETKEITKTVTNTTTVTSTTTAPGTTKTVTTTAQGGSTTITKYACPACSQEFDSIAALKAHFEATHPGEGTIVSEAIGSMVAVNMTVNGKKHQVFAKPHWPLRDVLRNQLGLISIKDMCTGYGACGSCSVIMNGRPILSCMTLAIECEGAEIVTCEALADAEDPLIEAYSKHHAMQCGFCTPGFVITARALLEHNPNPTIDEINEALSGNLCRCDTYPAHVLAIREVAGNQ
ncbi:MAG: (2Fe-2S)-binding protein [Dehalococcoidales bacterium]|jgi:aerobic-type carbon monoxide dehydrogenase small subunit (CoxS/CutS family)|nr:(2Fe-2S)-binding protein [Dehalococcoidales bacterium]MDD4466050.1 (2Fe-2S)-binding protein [Dehalococcoidales bacterium]MDD5402763.1 (2Fe-2S)-binding protein [Dehalococcoidales bacterium]